MITPSEARWDVFVRGLLCDKVLELFCRVYLFIRISDYIEKNLFQLLWGALRRKMVLRLLFSPVGEFFDRLNVIRKKKFCDYHEN